MSHRHHFADFPKGQAVPWRAPHRGREVEGEVVVADSWDTALGRGLRQAFRIVVLTQPQAVPAADVVDPRLAVYIQGAAPETAVEGWVLREPVAPYIVDRWLSRVEPAIDVAKVVAAPDDEQRLNLVASALLEGVEAAWKATLPWARALEPGLEAEPTFDSIQDQQARLREKLRRLGTTIPEIEAGLRQLELGLGQPLDKKFLQALDSLQSLCSGQSFLDFHAAAKERYPAAQALSQEMSLYQRLSQLAQSVPEIVTARIYLEDAQVGPGDPELEMDRVSLLEQLDMANLVSSSHLWPSIKALLDWFKARYSSQYQAHHSRYHLRLAELRAMVELASPRLQALQRLNSLEALGSPLGQGLGQRYERLLPQLTPCSVREVAVQDQPRCPDCRLALDVQPPEAEVRAFLTELDAALRQQQRRLSAEAIRRILARRNEPRLDRFLKVVQASDLGALTEVLDDELAAFLRALLAEARS